MVVECNGSSSSEFAYLIQRTETCLQILNQSSAIHTKRKRLTHLWVPTDYLVLESQRCIQSRMPPHRALTLYLPHAPQLHHWLLVPQWLLITKTRLWCELNQPCLFIWPEDGGNQCLLAPLHSSTLLLSLCPPFSHSSITSISPAQGW